MRRRGARYRVCVSMAYEVGGEERRECIENLSRHGLFACPGAGLAAGSEIEVEIAFPGIEGAHRCRVRVAHRLDEGDAGVQGRRGGVGLEFADTGGAFQDALTAYLERLGRRGDALVWTCEEASRLLLSAAGYGVAAAPEPEALAAALDEAPAALAVVATAATARLYEAVARDLGREDLIVTMDDDGDVDRVLAELDARL